MLPIKIYIYIYIYILTVNIRLLTAFPHPISKLTYKVHYYSQRIQCFTLTISAFLIVGTPLKKTLMTVYIYIFNAEADRPRFKRSLVC